MNTTATMSALIAIGERAVELHALEGERRVAKFALDEAYQAHREKAGLTFDRYETNTPEWEGMMEATAAEYAAVKRAKSAERNAKRRLDTAIRALRNGGRA